MNKGIFYSKGECPKMYVQGFVQDSMSMSNGLGYEHGVGFMFKDEFPWRKVSGISKGVGLCPWCQWYDQWVGIMSKSECPREYVYGYVQGDRSIQGVSGMKKGQVYVQG